MAETFKAKTATAATERRSSPVAIGLAWAIVVLPTLWGLTHTVENAMKIFSRPAAQMSVTAPVK